MASGWPRVSGGSRERENGPDFRGCSGSDGRRDADGSWHITENSFPGSWTSKVGKREHDTAQDWGAHSVGRGDSAENISSDKSGGRNSERNGYADRRGSRWHEGECNRNGSSKNQNRNGQLSWLDPSFKRVVDVRTHDERDRFGSNGCSRDNRQRRGWEGNRRHGRNWDRAGAARGSAGSYFRQSSSLRSAEQQKPLEVARPAALAPDHPVSDGNDLSDTILLAQDAVLKDNSFWGGRMHLSLEVSSGDNRSVGLEKAVDTASKPFSAKLVVQPVTENMTRKANESISSNEIPHLGDPSAFRSTFNGLENRWDGNSVKHMELSVLQDSAARALTPMSWSDHAEVLVNSHSSSAGGWHYIDRDGVLQGPVRLVELKQQSVSHELMLDHLVIRSGTNEWVTLEHARSPGDSQRVLGESASAEHYLSGVAQLVQTVGSVHAVRGDEKPSNGIGVAFTSVKPDTQMQLEYSRTAGYSEIDHQIDARVEAFMRGFPLVPGKEKETVFAALSTASQRWHHENEMESVTEESPRSHVGYTDYGDQWKDCEFESEVLGLNNSNGDGQTVDDQVIKVVASTDKALENSVAPLAAAVKEGKCSPEGMQSCNWPSRGGDWKLVFLPQVETSGIVDKSAPRKLVLNGGKSLCEVTKSGLSDPRISDPQKKASAEAATQSLEVPQFVLKMLEKKLARQKSEVVVDDQADIAQLSTNISQAPAKSKLQIPTSGAQRSTPKRGLSNPLKLSAATPAGGLKSLKAGKTPPSRVAASERALGFCGNMKASSGYFGKNGFPQTVDSPPVGGELETVANEHTGKRKFISGHLDDIRVEKLQKVQLDDVIQKRAATPGSEALPLWPEAIISGVVPSCNSRLLMDAEKSEWFFLNDSGVECGPFSYAKLKVLARSGSLLDGSTIYRKINNEQVPTLWKFLWDPSPAHENEKQSSEALRRLKTPLACQTTDDIYSPSDPLPRVVCEEGEVKTGGRDPVYKDGDAMEIHREDPQFIMYTGEKLHEYVMKAYRAQIFAAALTEGLDSWLLKKRSETGASTLVVASPQLCAHSISAPTPSPSTSHDSQATRRSHEGVLPADNLKGSGSGPTTCVVLPEGGALYATTQRDTQFGQLGASEDSLVDHEVVKGWRPNARETKQVSDYSMQQHSYRRRFIPADSSDDEDNMRVLEEKSTQLGLNQLKEQQIEAHVSDDVTVREMGCHLLKQPDILMKVFRCLNGNLRDLLAAGKTCKTWKLVVEKWKAEATSIDLSSLGELCSSKTISSLVGIGGGKLREVILRGCKSVTPDSLEQLLQHCPSISLVDISGCPQLMNFAKKGFPHVKWVGCNGDSSLYRKRQGSHGRTKSLKMISDKRANLGQPSEEHFMYSSEYSSTKGKTLENSSTAASMLTHTTVLSRDGDPVDFTLEASSDVRKRLKLHNGGKTSGGKHEHSRTVKYDNGDDSKTYHGLFDEKKLRSISKQLSSSSHRTSEKLVSPQKKHEKRSRFPAPSLTDGERTWERETLLLVEKMKKADPKQLLYRAVPDEKSGGGGMDILTIEKKQKEGAYCGSKGWEAIKSDIQSLTRQAFRCRVGSEKYVVAENIFKATEKLQTKVKKSLQAPTLELHLKSGKRSGPSELKGRKRAREDVFKVRTDTAKKVKDEGGTESDMSHERDLKRATKLKKTRWSKPEAESSEEDAEDEGIFEDEGEETETDEGGSEMSSQSEGDVSGDDDNDFSDYDGRRPDGGTRDWGARMTKSGMVPPVTRKYEVIEEYKVVADHERVRQKMTVELPEDYEQKVQAAQQKRGAEYAHLDIPEVKERQPPRKKLGEEVVEQEVYGIDPYTHNLLLDTMPEDTEDFAEIQKQQFIEETLLWALNKDVSHFDRGEAPMEYPLDRIVDQILEEARAAKNHRLVDFCGGLLRNMKVRQSKEKAETRDRYVAYRKGLGVVCNKAGGFEMDDFVVEFFGEVYPPWRWYEKQDGIRALQKKEKDQAPEFYNIFLERPKRDAAGYDLLVVDAMHKANFASRLCHSCRPNCEAKVTAVDGQYMIGVYTLRAVNCGEELTFDYNSVTESKEEYNSSVCLCGNQGCRGSYLNLAGASTYQEVMRKCHGLLDRHHLLLEACSRSEVSELDWEEMKQAGLGTCLLSGLPKWAIKFAVHLVKYINMEKVKLPDELMKEKMRKRRLFLYDSMTEQERLEYDRADAEVQTEGVYNQRLQNLAITLDKVRHVLTKIYKQPEIAPPPLKMLAGDELVNRVWKGLVADHLLSTIHPHLDKDAFHSLKKRIQDHEPATSGRVEDNLRRSLIWLRDELRKLPATVVARHDAAADVVHLYAYTEHFFTNEVYEEVVSDAIKIDALDIGPRHTHASFGATRWEKRYPTEYVWGQLINWFKQTSSPEINLSKERRGCLMLPDLTWCYYSKELHLESKRTYGSKQRLEMITLMEKKRQKQWPKSLCEFKSGMGIYGSPMLDAVILGKELNREMVHWLRTRSTVFQGPYDD